MTKSPTMRALVLESYNSAFVLREIARPAPGKGQVLVRIMASGVNPLDTKIRSGNAVNAFVFTGSKIGNHDLVLAELLPMNKRGLRLSWVLVQGTAGPLRYAPVRMTNSLRPKD
jgi:hypothetical protein